MRPIKGIVVDGSSRGNPGESKYKALDIESGDILFDIDIETSTNNIAEFCGLVHAIKYSLQNGRLDVFCDSVTAIAWVRNKKANTNLHKNNKTEKSINLMRECESYLKTLPTDYFHLVKKWDTKQWGENPADYGFK